MNQRKIAFIVCTNDDFIWQEALKYISLLYLPENYSLEILEIRNAKSMAAGYNEGMKASDAKYKVYLRQNTFLRNRNFIADMLSLFEYDNKIGMIGLSGSLQLPKDGVIWHGLMVGEGKRRAQWDTYQYRLEEDGFWEVAAAEGALLATQYDIPWREDLFQGQDFYDISQSFEMHRAGYQVVVPSQNCLWYLRENKTIQELWDYNRDRKIFLEEYQPEYRMSFRDKERKLAKIQGKKRILILQGGNAILDYTSDQFALAFQKKGYLVSKINALDLETEGERLLELLQNSVFMAMVFNNIGWSIKYKDQSIWDTFHVPCINYILDHPCYYADPIRKAPHYGFLACVDRNHVRFAERFYKNLSGTFFLPLAGEDKTHGKWKRWEERTTSVLYVGSCKQPEAFQLDEFGALVFRRLQEKREITLEDAIEEYAVTYLPNASQDDLGKLIEQQCKVDMCIKHWIRVEVISILVNAGIDVEVYGKNWEQTKVWDNPHFHYGGMICQEACLQKMLDSKIVLNVMPWFKDGMHDRVINAMLAGAVCVTDNSAYLEANFTAGQDYIRFSLNELQNLPDMIKSILSDKEKALKMIHQANNKAQKGHLWDERADRVIKQIEKNTIMC